MRPNLFIIGAMKSGTSSLHAYLGAHPEIFMCEPKEPCYFVDPRQLDWPEIYAHGFWRGEKNYLDLFSDAGDATIVGESSTLYTKLPKITGVPERLAQFCPGARLIYLMRDPIQRTISHYWHHVREMRESRDIFTAIKRDMHYSDVSYYAMQLRPYLSLFGVERVKTLTFERLVSQPAEVMAELFCWLGVDATFVPPNLGAKENATPKVAQGATAGGLLHRLRFSNLWARFGRYCPAAMRKFAVERAYCEIDRDDVDASAVVELLLARERDRVAELSEMLGRDFPEWAAVSRRPSEPLGC